MSLATTKQQVINAHSKVDKGVYFAMCSPNARQPLRSSIERDVEEFIKRGGNVRECTPAHNVSAPQPQDKLSDERQRDLKVKLKALKSAIGKNCNIRWDVSTDKFKAFYKDREIGNGFSDPAQAVQAIKEAALPIKV